MSKRFRMLRFVSALYKILAWIVAALTVLGVVLMVLVGALTGRAGAPSPLLQPIPGLGQVIGLGQGLAMAGLALLAGLIQFVFLYAIGEAIQLALAIEDNTRKSAYYLSGEGTLPPPPPSGGWAGTEEARS